MERKDLVCAGNISEVKRREDISCGWIRNWLMDVKVSHIFRVGWGWQDIQRWWRGSTTEALWEWATYPLLFVPGAKMQHKGENMGVAYWPGSLRTQAGAWCCGPELTWKGMLFLGCGFVCMSMSERVMDTLSECPLTATTFIGCLLGTVNFLSILHVSLAPQQFYYYCFYFYYERYKT